MKINYSLPLVLLRIGAFVQQAESYLSILIYVKENSVVHSYMRLFHAHQLRPVPSHLALSFCWLDAFMGNESLLM